MSLCPVFVAPLWNLLAICFSLALWLGVTLTGPSPSCLSFPTSPVLELRHLFGFSSSEYHSLPQVFGYMLNACKFFLWTQRNNLRFRSIRPSAVALIAHIKGQLRFYLRFSSSDLLLKGNLLSLLDSGAPMVWSAVFIMGLLGLFF